MQCLRKLIASIKFFFGEIPALIFRFLTTLLVYIVALFKYNINRQIKCLNKQLRMKQSSICLTFLTYKWEPADLNTRVFLGTQTSIHRSSCFHGDNTTWLALLDDYIFVCLERGAINMTVWFSIIPS